MSIFLKTKKLNNGVEMPVFGLGTWKMTDPIKGAEAVKIALNLGYKHIDTAFAYKNAELIKKGISMSNVDRKDIFITSKVWNFNREFLTKADAAKQIDLILKQLNVSYIDLMLVHWPSLDALNVYHALEDAYHQKKIRAIGVSNFTISNLEDFLKKISIKPVVNQIQVSPGILRTELTKYCLKNNIQITTWKPLGQNIGLLENETIVSIAKKHKKLPSQIALKWALQKNYMIIPKSITPSRIITNSQLDDFKLDKEDIFNIENKIPVHKPDWY